MLDSDFYDHIQSLWGAYAQAMGAMRAQDEELPTPPHPLLQLRAGYAESPGWFILQAAEFAPDPLTVQDLRLRDVYAAESLVLALLELMASEKWFDRNGETYTLRIEGQAILDKVQSNRCRWLSMLTMPDEPTNRLQHQFGALIESSLHSPTPPGTWCLAHSRRRVPADGNGAANLFQYVADFNAFRDDCHMAAWQPTGVAGLEWEALSLVGDGTADKAEALFQQLAHRGYSTNDYAIALDHLAERGWVQAADSHYEITARGRSIRREVEEQTDAAFYAPWRILTDAEQQQIHDDISVLTAQLANVTAASK